MLNIKSLSGSLAVAAAISVAGFAQAATVPGDFDSIFTEGQRTQTVDGADVSGNAAVSGNGDVSNFDLGDVSGNTLIVGRVTGTGSDAFSATNVSGFAKVTVLSFAESSRGGQSPFSAVFEFFANGSSVNAITLGGSNPTVITNQQVGGFNFNGGDLSVVVTSETGASDYDIGISVTAVPVPAAGLLLMGALGGLGLARRRKKA